MSDQPHDEEFDDPSGIDASDEQLAELARLGIAEDDLRGLSWAGAEEMIERLQSRRDAGRFGPPPRPRSG